QKIHDMMSGKIINKSESKSVGHFNLRHTNRYKTEEWSKLVTFANLIIKNINIKNIINIGIGGSNLGPSMVTDCLKPYKSNLKISYISNLDPSNISDVLENCDPSKTLFIITSKSFSTFDTINNANIAKEWLLKSGQNIEDKIVAVTARKDNALKWGIINDNIFHFSEDVGGRFSLWSSVGLPIILSIGEKHFKDFLNGAHEMDKHFINEDIENNIPIIMALIRIFNRNFLNRPSHCIIPYDNRLSKLPSWVQQLEMESNGKGTDIDGEELLMPASPLIWGEVGTNAQHSFFQFLHQGMETHPIDLLIPRNPIDTKVINNYNISHKHLVISAIAQAESLAIGCPNLIDKNKNFSGGIPSTLISWKESNPYSIGMLLSLYENITISCGFIWNVNSFDQWGIELGKKLALKIELNQEDKELSPSARKFL
ncbi:glucose-6-phosphate isomerase, partial [Alphaproteobacteria bacterium]|nr:glucose-6-phosphate isomerase [Alphaproteobacteria bacterium]